MKGDITAQEIIPFLKKDVVWYAANSIIPESDEDICILSREYQKITDVKNAVVYEELLYELVQYAEAICRRNYDYFYLKRAVRIAKTESLDTIVVGNSYPCFGIETAKMQKTINCALPSQDLYYAEKIIRDICDSNHSIKNVIIGGGYYLFHSDLSRTKNKSEINRIATVYAPIYGDGHHCLILPHNECELPKDGIFDMEKIIASFYEEAEPAISYFGKRKGNRMMNQLKMWKEKNRSWQDLSEIQKEEAGKERASAHNKSIDRKATYQENIKIIKSLGVYLSEKNIHMIMAVFPATTYYRNGADTRFRDLYYEALENIESTVHVIDCYDADIFQNEDFIDTDHLGDKGAEKMTYIVKELIREIHA